MLLSAQIAVEPEEKVQKKPIELVVQEDDDGFAVFGAVVGDVLIAHPFYSVDGTQEVDPGVAYGIDQLTAMAIRDANSLMAAMVNSASLEMSKILEMSIAGAPGESASGFVSSNEGRNAMSKIAAAQLQVEFASRGLEFQNCLA